MPLDFVKFARAKGLSERRIVSVHVLKNIMIPIVTVVGVEFGGLIAFAIVTETIFAWPGMGKLLIDFDHAPRPAGGGRLPARGRDPVHRHQLRRRHPLLAARSAYPPRERVSDRDLASAKPSTGHASSVVPCDGILQSPEGDDRGRSVCILLLADRVDRSLARAAEPLRPDADQHHGCQARRRARRAWRAAPIGSARTDRAATCCRP